MKTVQANMSKIAVKNNKVDTVLEQIIKAYDPEKVYLFGSAARGDDDEYSDLDLAVIAQSSLTFVKRLRQSVDLIDAPKTDVLIYTPEEFDEMLEKGNYFAQDIIAGKLIYEKSG